SNLAMEPPGRFDSESIRDEKVKVLRSIPALEPADVVRGQVEGYKGEQGVAPSSQTETFAAVRLRVNTWRWQGVPFFIRAGKSLAVTCTEIVLRMRRPPMLFPSCAYTSNHFRFRISPDTTSAFGMTAMDEEETGVGRPVDLLPSRHAGPTEKDA